MNLLALEGAIDRSYVGWVKRGTENVTILRLGWFAQVLNVPVTRLFLEPDAEARLPAGLPAGRKFGSGA